MTTALSLRRGSGDAIRHARTPHIRDRWLRELAELLAIPSVSVEPRHRRDVAAAADWLVRHLGQLGLEARLLPGLGGPPSVYASRTDAPGQPTVLLYGHYDVQPIDPLRDWSGPPFRAVFHQGRVIARGASDDKGQLFTHLKAIESLLATTGRLPVNVKVWLEGEEEVGSPHLTRVFDAHAADLRADVALVSDTAMLGRGQPTIGYGLRGLVTGEIVVQGAKKDLHSGQFGGAIQNPAHVLAGLVSSLHAADGSVRLHRFYDHVRDIDELERAHLASVGPSDATLRDRAGVDTGWGEPGYSMFERVTIRPSVTITRLASGAPGSKGRAVVPRDAKARLSIRLVAEQNPDDVVASVTRHVALRSPPPSVGVFTPAARVAPVLLPHESRAIRIAAKALEDSFGAPATLVRTGGTVPVVSHLWHRLGVPSVVAGFALPDDNWHAPNEKFELDHLYRGVETVVRFLTGLAR